MLAFSHSCHSVFLAESKFICQQAILIPQGHIEINIFSFMTFFQLFLFMCNTIMMIEDTDDNSNGNKSSSSF